MSDLVRVRRDGFKFNVGTAYAAVHELEVLDEPTHDRAGKAIGPTRENDRPIKPRTTVDKAATKTPTAETAVAKKAAQSADQSDTALIEGD